MNDINERLINLLGDMKVIEYKMEQKDRRITELEQEVLDLKTAASNHTPTEAKNEQ